MSGRRRSPPPPPRSRERYRDSGDFEAKRSGRGSSSRYDETSSRRRSPSPREHRGAREDDRDRYRDERDRHHSYRVSDRERADVYSDSRAPRPRPAAYEEDRDDRNYRRHPANHSGQSHSSSSRTSRRSRSPRAAPPQPHSQAEDPPPSPPERSTNQDVIAKGRQNDIESLNNAIINSSRHEKASSHDANEDLEADDEDGMAAMMGFGGFSTTKNRKVSGNDAGAAEIKKERTWRQYMNRCVARTGWRSGGRARFD